MGRRVYHKIMGLKQAMLLREFNFGLDEVTGTIPKYATIYVFPDLIQGSYLGVYRSQEMFIPQELVVINDQIST